MQTMIITNWDMVKSYVSMENDSIYIYMGCLGHYIACRLCKFQLFDVLNMSDFSDGGNKPDSIPDHSVLLWEISARRALIEVA